MIALECPLFPFSPQLTLLSAVPPVPAAPAPAGDGVTIACAFACLIWAVATAIILRAERIHHFNTP